MNTNIGRNNLFMQIQPECFSWEEWAEKVRRESQQEYIHHMLQQLFHSTSSNNSNYTEGVRHGIEIMQYIHKVQYDAKEFVQYLISNTQSGASSSSSAAEEEMEEYDLEQLDVDGDSEDSSSDVEYLEQQEQTNHSDGTSSSQFIHDFAKQKVQQLLQTQLLHAEQ